MYLIRTWAAVSVLIYSLSCFASIGTSRVLAVAFDPLATASGGGILEDVLAALLSIEPLDEEAAMICPDCPP